MTNPVVMSNKVARNLNELTILEDEVAGYLLYLSLNGTDFVSRTYMGAVGSPGTVTNSPERTRVVNEVLKKVGNSGAIEFHTHSRGTINRFGSTYQYIFSNGDREAIAENGTADPEYMHLLVTPARMLLAEYSPQQHDIRTLPFTIKTFPGAERQEQTFTEVLKWAEQKLGLPPINLTSRRV